MKNKIEEQKLKKEEDKKNLADQKKAKRRKESNLVRNSPQKEVKKLYLIYCEGENTEPSYFKKFKLSNVTVDCFGRGENTLSLVKKAKEYADKKDYDQVWCVFDADPKPDNLSQKPNFNAAVNLAIKYNFEVAYSNQAFEYWLILHFEDHQGGGMDRKDYGDKINSYLSSNKLKYDFDGSKKISQEFFDLLLDNVQIAITRAKRIYDQYDHSSPANEESSTTVFKLVEELLSQI